MPPSDHPHENQPLLDRGADLADASVAMILLHGRGASARSILGLADELDVPDVAYLAPQAARRSWYPESFMAPVDQNEPHLSSALRVVGDTIEHATAGDLSVERVVLLGFSQGACLATEYAARHPQRYGGVVGLSGGLIGPEDTDFAVDGTLDGTPVFLGCSDEDPYIPLERVNETAEVLRRLSAKVTKRIYEGMGHTTNADELQHVRALLEQYVDPTTAPSFPPDADENGDAA
jgi:phospholipase/carboxylesterase